MPIGNCEKAYKAALQRLRHLPVTAYGYVMVTGIAEDALKWRHWRVHIELEMSPTWWKKYPGTRCAITVEQISADAALENYLQERQDNNDRFNIKEQEILYAQVELLNG